MNLNIQTMNMPVTMTTSTQNDLKVSKIVNTTLLHNGVSETQLKVSNTDKTTSKNNKMSKKALKVSQFNNKTHTNDTMNTNDTTNINDTMNINDTIHDTTTHTNNKKININKRAATKMLAQVKNWDTRAERLAKIKM